MVSSNYFYLEWVACGYCWILSLIVIFYLYHFIRARHAHVSGMRYFVLILLLDICTIVSVSYLAPFWILVQITETLQHKQLGTFYINILIGYPYIVCQHLFTCLIMCRFWLLHYEIKWRFHAKQLAILEQINKNAKQISWYIRNEATFGSLKFCIWTTVICALLISICSCIVYFLYFDSDDRFFWYLCDSIFLFVPLLFAFIIWYKTPSFFDYFLIRKELSFVIAFGTIGIFGYVMTILSLLFYENILMIGIIMEATMYCLISLTSTLWILQYSGMQMLILSKFVRGSIVCMIHYIESTQRAKIGKNKKIKNINAQSVQLSEKSPERSPNLMPDPVLSKSSSVIPELVLKHIQSDRVLFDGRERRETDVFTRKATVDANELTLYECLEDEYGFHAFLIHTVKEYSVENLLAVVEFQQFQDLYDGKRRDKRLSCNKRDENSPISPPINVMAPVPSATIPSPSVSREPEPKSPSTSGSEERSPPIHGHVSALSTFKLSVSDDLAAVQIQNHSFILPPIIPKSSIVHDEKLSMREKIVALTGKYISRGGDYELNLGSSHRAFLLKRREVLDEMDDDECAAIFNETIYTVIAVMHDSYIRFQATNSYEMLRRQWCPNAANKRKSGALL